MPFPPFSPPHIHTITFQPLTLYSGQPEKSAFLDGSWRQRAAMTLVLETALGLQTLDHFPKLGFLSREG